MEVTKIIFNFILLLLLCYIFNTKAIGYVIVVVIWLLSTVLHKKEENKYQLAEYHYRKLTQQKNKKVKKAVTYNNKNNRIYQKEKELKRIAQIQSEYKTQIRSKKQKVLNDFLEQNKL